MPNPIAMGSKPEFNVKLKITPPEMEYVVYDQMLPHTSFPGLDDYAEMQSDHVVHVVELSTNGISDWLVS